MNRTILYILFISAWMLLAAPAHAFQTNADSSSAIKQRGEAKAIYIQALQSFENQQYDQSLELLTTAYPTLNKNSGVNFALADVYYQLGNMQEAILYAGKAVKIDQANKWYRLKLAEMYETTGQNSRAIQQLEAAIEHHPNDTYIREQLAVAYANDGSLMKAKNQYNRLIQLKGASIPLHMQKIKIFSRLGMNDSLAVELNNIEDLKPVDAETLKLLSSYYEKLGKNQQAQQMLIKAGADQPNDINTLKLRAGNYIQTAQWDSLSLLGTSVMDDPKLSAEEKTEFAEALYELFDTQKSSQIPADKMQGIIEQLLQSTPNFSAARKLAANFFITTDQPDKALKELAAITTSSPGDKEAWQQRLGLLLKEENTNAALEAALQANDYLPQEPFIYYVIGHSYLEQSNTSQALEWLKKAADLPARSSLKSTILKSLGETYFQLQQWQKAFDSYQNALDYSEADAGIMEQMGDAMDKLNKPDEARNWWQKALIQDPDNQELKDKLSQ